MHRSQKTHLLFVLLATLLLCLSFSKSYAAEVTLSWARPDDSRITGYNVYCVESGTEFTAAPVQSVQSADQTSCTISGLEEGQTYDFAATSFDGNGNESDFSEVISHQVASANPAPEDIDDDGDGYTENEGDCNDGDPQIFPGATEICGDGIDQDCNGADLACTDDGANLIDQAQMRITYVDSQETAAEDGAAGNAIDGDETTIWHTEWYHSRPAHPHEIVINLGGTYEVQSLRYLPRQDGSENGMIADYEIYVSQDGTDWGAPVHASTWANSLAEKEAVFAARTGQYVRLVALSEVNGTRLTSAAEINIMGTEATTAETDNDGDGYSPNQGDCNDNDATVYPGAPEICGDGIDQDCSGTDLTCPEDIDNDGDGYTENQGDCNDSDPSIHPGASEICGDGIDQNCSGSDLICPEDIDDDGDGYTENQGDCNDSDPSVHPNAAEICGDGIDQDCSGGDATCPENIDDDGDGYTESEGDCNDSDGTIFPGAIEVCGDGIDQNCSGSDQSCTAEPEEPGSEFAIETGETEINHQWQSVSFSRTFANPVVVAKPMGLNGEQPAVVRIRNVTSQGFEIRIQEWEYLDGWHTIENVSYIVMEAGSHTLSNGIRVEAGTFEADSANSVNFQQPFNHAPVIACGVTTENDLDAVTGRVSSVSAEGFAFMLQEQEANRDGHAGQETISYIAWEPSEGTVNGIKYVVDRTFNEITNDFHSISFHSSFTDEPVLIADMQTRNGGDTANIRHRNKSASGIEFQIDEEQSQNSEVNHIPEVVGYMAFAPAPDTQNFVLETGEAAIVHEWTTVNLNKNFTNPVVVAKPLSIMGPDPGVTRITNVSRSGFDIRIQEWDYLNGSHGTENAGYMVVESGSHELTNGAKLEAGTFTASSTRSIQFEQAFNRSPVVICSVITENEPDTVTGRIHHVTPTGFEFVLQEQEANTDGHNANESVSYIAWEPSSGTIDGVNYAVDRTLNEVTSSRYHIPFSPSFESVPVFVADMQTYNGTDPANVRWHTKDINGVEVAIDEEQSMDSEVDHIAEVVGYMVFSSGSSDSQ